MKRLGSRLLVVLGLVQLAFVAGIVMRATWYQRGEARRVESFPTREAGQIVVAGATRREVAANGLVGTIEVPRLGIDAVIAEGTGDGVLNRAVGHIEGSAFPGEPDNVALAGHRDTFFRGLGGVVPGDRIRLRTPDGVFAYRVDTLMIVRPSRGDLVESTGRPMLTLVTCYPFHYIGHAPRRFIVRATLDPELATGNFGEVR